MIAPRLLARLGSALALLGLLACALALGLGFVAAFAAPDTAGRALRLALPLAANGCAVLVLGLAALVGGERGRP